jgi:hypothetical protein
MGCLIEFLRFAAEGIGWLVFGLVILGLFIRFFADREEDGDEFF